MIAENEFVLNRAKEFRNSKYIIIARLEQAGSAESTTIEGRISGLKNHFESATSELKKDLQTGNEQSKDEMIATIKQVDAKIQEQQTNSVKLNF